jgi:hypothetical protein
MSSIYNAANTPDPFAWATGANDEQLKFAKVQTYGETHVRYAKEYIDETEGTGERIWECYQGLHC